MADARVLVLDEPTAHLDPETADELIRDVSASAGDRPILIVPGGSNDAAGATVANTLAE